MTNLDAITMRRILLALMLSIVITFVLITAYAFYPLIAALLRRMTAPETHGIAVVAGGVSWFAFLLVEPIVFVIIFVLLNCKKTSQ